MDRSIIYPGAIPLAEDLLNIQRSVLKAFGYSLQVALGTSAVADGLSCGPTAPATMSLIIGPGSLTGYTVIDGNAFSTLEPDLNPLLKQGISEGATTLPFSAPPQPGTSVDYLIQGALEELDGSPVVLPYYNATNPAQPYSGPGGAGASQNTIRAEAVSLQTKAGVPAPTGSQTPPVADAGWVPLYVISVPAGALSLTQANISVAPGAPFLSMKLPQLVAAVAALQGSTSATATNLTSEAGRAEAAEAAIASGLAAEIARAEASEGGLEGQIAGVNSALAAELSRAQGVEASINTSLSNSVSSLSGSLSAETGARTTAVNNLYAAISGLIANGNTPTGYLRLGTSYIQWGTGTISNGSAYISFPVTFPNVCYAVFAGEVDSGGWIYGGGLNPVAYGNDGAPSQSGATIIGVTTLATGGTAANNGGGFYWFAIGC